MPSRTGLDSQELVRRIRIAQARLRDALLEQTGDAEVSDLTRVVEESSGDTIYGIDRISETVLRDVFKEALAEDCTYVLIGEGLTDGGEVFPEGGDSARAEFRIIVDPIDGTRGLMYDKRSAWVLTGVAENRGDATRLSDIFAAVQTEIPTRKQYRCDVLWAVRGEGAGGESYDRIRDTTSPLPLHPSRAESIEHGFAMISRFFPGGKEILAALEERLAEELIGPVVPGRARLFEDQYISTGGQLYELIVGHDRFNADLRPMLEKALAERGTAAGISCHPYDICTALIAQEAGVIVTDPMGQPLVAPLDTTHPIAWSGYANSSLRDQIAPVLQRLLQEFELAP